MVKPLTVRDAGQMGQMHFDSLRNDFLPSFGVKFLEKLHQHILKLDDVISLGYYHDNHLQGFLIATPKTSHFMKSVLWTGFGDLFPIVLRKIITAPKTIIYILETLLYGNKNEVEAELLILVVNKKQRNQGIGTRLMLELIKEYRLRKINTFKVGTLATNLGANSFYKKLGGKYDYSYDLYKKRWNVYIYNT